MKWDYTVVNAKSHGWLLNELIGPGELGWELVSVMLYGAEGSSNRVVGFLKRPKVTMTTAQAAATARRKAAAKSRTAKARRRR